MADTDELLGPDGQPEPSAPRPKAPPIESRFLYVDVAAMRAKQLRRGALPRLSADDDGAWTLRGHGYDLSDSRCRSSDSTSLIVATSVGCLSCDKRAMYRRRRP